MLPFDLPGTIDLSTFRLPVPIALALVALLGYLVGRRRYTSAELAGQVPNRELRRAQGVARELERIAARIRGQLAGHQARVAKFKRQIGRLCNQQQEVAWKELCKEADTILTSTLELATQIASAHDQLRQQTSHLMTFTEVRVDALTGIGNRRGLDDALASHLAIFSRYRQTFSVALFDIDHFKRINDEQGHLQGDLVLRQVAKLLDGSVRETDVVARYGGEEFVVIMPQTALEGACVFAERWREAVGEQLPLTISGGVTTVLDGDSADSLLARADAALYAAKSAGRNCICRHTGAQIESIFEPVAPVA